MVTILIAGSGGGVGKTTVAANAAYILAARKGKTVGYIAYEFGRENPTSLIAPELLQTPHKTLADYLLGGAEVDEVIYPVERGKGSILFVPGTGMQHVMLQKLIAAHRHVDIRKKIAQRIELLWKLIVRLKQLGADLIIIDGPAPGAFMANLDLLTLYAVSDVMIPVVEPSVPTIENTRGLVEQALVFDVAVPAVVINKYTPKFKNLELAVSTLLPAGGDILRLHSTPRATEQYAAGVLLVNRGPDVVRKDLFKIADKISELSTSFPEKPEPSLPARVFGDAVAEVARPPEPKVKSVAEAAGVSPSPAVEEVTAPPPPPPPPPVVAPQKTSRPSPEAPARPPTEARREEARVPGEEAPAPPAEMREETQRAKKLSEKEILEMLLGRKLAVTEQEEEASAEEKPEKDVESRVEEAGGPAGDEGPAQAAPSPELVVEGARALRAPRGVGEAPRHAGGERRAIPVVARPRGKKKVVIRMIPRTFRAPKSYITPLVLASVILPTLIGFYVAKTFAISVRPPLAVLPGFLTAAEAILALGVMLTFTAFIDLAYPFPLLLITAVGSLVVAGAGGRMMSVEGITLTAWFLVIAVISSAINEIEGAMKKTAIAGVSILMSAIPYLVESGRIYIRGNPFPTRTPIVSWIVGWLPIAIVAIYAAAYAASRITAKVTVEQDIDEMVARGEEQIRRLLLQEVG